ncbi:MAG: DUF2975 domain-containing protein [Cyclobacteriaceae bacterium]|nr:DUF2975 domain-containing protein [Cyclobacteriaceae bacterium]
MTKRNDFIWNAIQTVCWLIFAGFCVQTGALVFNYAYSLFRPVATHDLHLGLDLSELYNKNIAVYTVLFVIIVALSALKAYVFYTVIRIFKMLNLVKPFSDQVHQFILKTTYYAFTIGVISFVAHEIVKKLEAKDYQVGVIERYWNDSGAYFIMSAILFVIALIFKKGIEMQNESDLTV